MKIDYSYHYRKWNRDTDEQRQVAIKSYSNLYDEFLPRDKNARILDVGCGIGYMLGTLRALGYTNVSGIDIDPGQVEICCKRGFDVTLVDDSKTYLQRNAGAFDQILAFDLLEHIPHDAQLEFAAALAGALKLGGNFMCTVPNANSFVAMRYRHIDWTHQDSFTEQSLDFLLHSGGFSNIRVLPAEKMAKPTWWWIPTRAARFWWAWKLVRGWRRLQFMAELGPAAGRSIPLSANLLGLASRS